MSSSDPRRAYSIDDLGTSRWQPTTLREQGKDEGYLERLIGDDPLILGLDPYLTGLGTDFRAFRQTRLESSTARPLRPDVVLLTGTGHVVIVEVKLADNPGLRDRGVISQIVDYAAAVAALNEEALVSWLGQEQDALWIDVINREFPSAHDPERLASALRDRLERADIHLVIACDQAPLGLRDTMRLISAQSALGDFQLHLVELTPYVNASRQGLLIIPRETARTEIVSRTAITVKQDAEHRVSVSIAAPSAVAVEEAMHQAGQGRSMRPEFQAVLDAFDRDAGEGLKTSGTALSYRQIKPTEWPGRVHYEFLDQRGGSRSIGVELHIESEDYPELCSLVQEMEQELAGKFPNLSVSTKWFKGCRLSVILPDGDPDLAADSMRTLISLTRASVQSRLGSTVASDHVS